MEMDADRWLAHFQTNSESRLEPEWAAPINLSPAVVARLVRSLEQFHLGDGGGPAGLIAWNAETFRSSSDAAKQLVDLWFNEEKEHSRLLCGAVKRFGGRTDCGPLELLGFLHGTAVVRRPIRTDGPLAHRDRQHRLLSAAAQAWR